MIEFKKLYNEGKTFLDIFLMQCKNNPNRIAVVDENKSLTYNELDEMSNSYANEILKRNCKEEDIVSILVERSVEFVASIIAIYKAGCAYLPIDPAYPKNRIMQMIQVANSDIIIIDPSILENEVKDEINTFKVINVNEIDLNNKCCEKPLPTQSNLSYIIFTSGTTGTPKGAMIEHKGMLNHLISKVDALDLNIDTKLIQTASQCFDISVWQFLSPIMVGGELHIINKYNVRDIQYLLNYIETNKIDIFETVPSYFKEIVNVLAASPGEYLLNNLKYILLTGEALPVSLCCDWYELKRQGTLVNAYGPTECSDDVTHYFVPENISREEKQVPIGTAVLNTDLYIVDSISPENSAVLTVNTEPGELYVGGDGVGRGYINDDTRTLQAFKRINVNGEEKLLYKTGDLVFRKEDGNIIFLGRVDRQVKVRGYRIELEEIEETIRKYPGVINCAVAKKEIRSDFVYFLDNETNTRKINEQSILVGYIVAKDDLNLNELKKLLSSKLPIFMVPEQFVFIESIPLTENGKININKLPEPNSVRPDELVNYVPPKTEIEKSMAKIWENILGISPIGLEDNFFELGGDSLTAIQILTRIKKDLQKDISYADFNSSENLKDLSQKLKDDSDAYEKIVPSNKKNNFELTYGQSGQWFLWKLFPANPYYTFQGILNVFGDTNYEKLNNSINCLVKNNTNLRTRFIEEINRPYQYVEDFVVKKYELIDYSNLSSSLADEKLREFAYNLAQTSFNLAEETMFKVQIFKMPEQKYSVLLTMHEIVMDAWATRSLIQDFVDIHAQIDKIDVKEFTYKSLQYTDFAEWEKTNITRDILSKERTFWTHNLSGELPVLEMPMDNKRPQIPSYIGKSQGIVLSEDLSKALKAFNKKNNVTLFTTLLSAFYLLLSKYSNQKDVIIGAPNASRDYEEVESMYGYFINMIPLRFNIDGNSDLNNLVSNAKSILNNAIEHSKYPFIWTVEDLKIERNSSYTPIFQVMFDMLNFPKVNFPSNSKISINFDELDVGYKKYDLEMYGHEQDNKIYVRLSYLADLYNDETISQMLRSYELIISQIVNEGQKCIDDLDILHNEDAKIVNKLNRLNELPEVFSYNIKDWIAHDLESNKEKIAFKDENNEISFGGLNDYIESTSAYFNQIGINQGKRVAVYSNKNINTISNICCLINNKSTYIPFDTLMPEERVYAIINTLGVNFVISDKILDCSDLELVSTYNDFNIYKNKNCLDGYKEAVCIIPTSSSTGDSKYVEINKEGFCNRLFWQMEELKPIKSDVIGSLRSPSLVTHIGELFGGLIYKNTTLLLSRETVLNAEKMLDYLSDNTVSYITLSPSILRIFVNTLKQGDNRLKSLRLIGCGSDILDNELADKFLELFPNVELYNTYGTTETSSTASFFRVRPRQEIINGKPIMGTRIRITDSNGKDLPPKIVGDISIFGKPVSNGYIAYIDDKFSISSDYTKSSFKTGDKGYVDRYGNFKLVGRKDRQIKIRGFRVNLSEVEENCRLLSGIELVACKTYQNNDVQGYAVLFVSSTLKEDDVRKELQKKYPEYMMPQMVIRVDSIPTTINGKVKYNELPDPIKLVESVHQEVEELDEYENEVLQIMTQILAFGNIKLDDDFFNIGGHSLAAIQLCSEISNKFGIDVNITDLYTGNSTIRKLSILIKEKGLVPDAVC